MNKKAKVASYSLLSIIGAMAMIFITLLIISGIGSSYAIDYINKNVESVDYQIDFFKGDNNDNNSKVFSRDSNAKILHITDIHLVASILTKRADRRAIQSIVQLVDVNEPDLIVVTGDIVYPKLLLGNTNSVLAVSAFGELMTALNVPFAITYGNHDDEGSMDKTAQSKYYQSLPNCLFVRGDESIDGQGNYVVEVFTPNHNEYQFNTALVMIDSNGYIARPNSYDYVHDNQVQWYQETIVSLKSRYGQDMRSIIYMHIPMYEHKIATRKYLAENDDVQYITGHQAKRAASTRSVKGKLFETIKALGSTKAVFVGHDHVNSAILKYQGVVLGYGMSIDYIAFPFAGLTKKYRGGTVLSIGSNISVSLARQADNYKTKQWFVIA